ncbi:MAG: carbohydrate porin [Planctomycetota bacterium]|jgi:porin
MKIVRVLLMAAVFLATASVCRAEDDLKARLAKLEAALKARRSAQKDAAAAESSQPVQAQATSDEAKTSAQTDEQPQAEPVNTEALQARISELEQKLQAALEARSKQQESELALVNRLAELESKVRVLETPTDEPAAEIIQAAELGAVADPVAVPEDPQGDFWTRDTLTDGFWGIADGLADQGIEVGFGITEIYQQTVRGANKRIHQGRHTGSYDFEIGGDLEKLAGIVGGSLYIHAEGSWSREDIDSTSVGSTFGVNADAAGRRAMDVTEVFYEQALFGEALTLRCGKLDITGGFECRGCPVSFDGSAFANDESAQFLNGALVNNPTIPFPDKGLGAVLYCNPVEWWYISAGAVDSHADARESGFNTGLHKEDHFFYVFETGVAPQSDSSNGPLQAAYRVGLWVDGTPKERFSNGKSVSDDTGVYLSCDRLLAKENDDPEDGQGLGFFSRYGWAGSKVNEVTNFWSAGLQYQGLFGGRDDDVLGVGFAQGIFSDEATDFTADSENVVELYYNAQVTPWLNLSPTLQYVGNPGGDEAASDAVVLGLRAQMAF